MFVCESQFQLTHYAVIHLSNPDKPTFVDGEASCTQTIVVLLLTLVTDVFGVRLLDLIDTLNKHYIPPFVVSALQILETTKGIAQVFNEEGTINCELGRL